MKRDKKGRFISNKIKYTKFHSKAKGCKTEPKMYYRETVSNKISSCKGLYCNTHNAECSKSGWEWGFYLGTPSKMLKK